MRYSCQWGIVVSRTGVLTSFLNDVQTSVGYIVILELVAFLECTDENRVVLGRYEGDCIQAEWRRHETRCRESLNGQLEVQRDMQQY